MSTVAFVTLGCRLNQVDSLELATRLEQRGFRTVPFEERADVVVVNTCTVTGRADVSDRQMIRRALRRHPGARVVVTGCWAQTDPDAVAAVAGVDVVVGNADKPRLPEIVEALLQDGAREAGAWGPAELEPPSRPAHSFARKASTRSASAPAATAARVPPGPTPWPLARLLPARVEVSDITSVRTMPAPAAPAHGSTGRARAFLKIQEGCQHRCAFCIVPLARGGSRSLAPTNVVEQARALVELGHVEIVLTGVDLGHYGADLRPRTSLAALVRALVDVPGLRRLRLSSVLAAYFTPELLDVVTGSAVVAPHLHVPLQSGSDRVLRRMRRPYNVTMYRGLVERLMAATPGLGLGADVIVGFPGESREDFAATMALVEHLPFSYLHVFGYSKRKDTAAAAFPDQVPAGVIASRSRALRALAAAKNLAFRRRMVGTVEDVLVLQARRRATGDLVGLTGNYVEVAFGGEDALMRTMTRVRVTAADASGTRGEARAR